MRKTAERARPKPPAPIAARWLFALLLVAAAAAAQALPSARQRGADFDAMRRAIERGYAYPDEAGGAWKRARAGWRARAVHARTRDEFLAALEGMLDTLHDDHVSLSERSGGASARRPPSQADLWARWRQGEAVIDAVRTFGDADVAGVVPGQVLARIDGVDADEAVRRMVGESAPPAARDWALRRLLAGPAEGVLRLEVRDARGLHALAVEHARTATSNGAPILARRIGERRDLGYLRLKRADEDARFVEHFDEALAYLHRTRALIIDLRETSGPASRSVVAALLARFAPAGTPWQRRAPRKAAATTDVVPQGPLRRAGPLVVLVDHWTAGEAEAFAAGLRAAAGARLIGTPMAGLRGELREVRLPHSRVVVRFPAEKVSLPDGTPRESLQPDIAVDLAAPKGGPGDPILYQALKFLERPRA